jgi:hypothetical protein
MGQKSSIDRLPENLRNKVIEMLNNPAMTQLDIVNTINAEVGKKFLTKSAMNRFILSTQKITGMKRGRKAPTIEESLVRTAVALERIAFSLENQYKKLN